MINKGSSPSPYPGFVPVEDLRNANEQIRQLRESNAAQEETLKSIQERAEPFRYALQDLADKDWHDDYTVFVDRALWDENGGSITAAHFYKLMAAIYGEFPKNNQRRDE